MTGMYRGLTKEGKVVLGCLFHHVTRAFIIDEYEMTEGLCTISSTPRSISGWIEVLPESLAQFTGKHDKNKKPIYGSFEIDEKMTGGGDTIKATFHFYLGGDVLGKIHHIMYLHGILGGVCLNYNDDDRRIKLNKENIKRYFQNIGYLHNLEVIEGGE